MIYGIYTKNRPKDKWALYSIAISAEAANYDLNEALTQAKLIGHDLAEVGLKTFNSTFYIPEHISEIKEEKPLFN